MRAPSLVFAVALVSLAAVGCGGGEEAATPSPAATAVLTESPTPTSRPTVPPPTAAASWTGPLLVYTKDVRSTDAVGRISDSYQVATFDLGAERELASFEVGGDGEHPRQIVISGNKIIANVGKRVVLYDSDGSDPRVLRQGYGHNGIIGIGASPDGTQLALTEERASPQTPDLVSGTYVVVLDIESGEEVLAVPQSAPGFVGFRGQVAEITWRDDGRGFIVQGFTYSERPGGTAEVMLDGSVRNYDLRGWVKIAPNGRYAEHGSFSPLPLGGLGGLPSEIVLYDLAAQTEMSSVADDSLLFAPREWSPDSTEFLYATYSPRASSQWPGYLEEDLASERFYLLRIDGSAPELVSDVETVHGWWYGERHVQLRCLGEIRHYPGCTDGKGRDQPMDIYVGDTFVGSGEDVEIVGFIDR